MKAILLILLLCASYAQVELGKIEVDAKAGSFTFPAKINQTEGIAEFLLVHKNGKVHEAIFSTEVRAIEINAALNLLGLKTDTENKTAIPIMSDLSKHPRLEIYISNAEKTVWHPATDFIAYRGTKDALSIQPWHYNGSYFYNDNFMSEVEGDLIAIYTNVNALINLEHSDRTDDTLWFPNAHKLGKKGDTTYIKIVIVKDTVDKQ